MSDWKIIEDALDKAHDTRLSGTELEGALIILTRLREREAQLEEALREISELPDKHEHTEIARRSLDNIVTAEK